MPNLVWAVVAACALAAHEYLVSRTAPPPARLRYSRLAMLLVLLTGAVALGPRIQAELASRRRTPPSPEWSFDATGDPLRTRALDAQRPKVPFPSTLQPGPVEAWKRDVLGQIAEHTGLDFTDTDHHAPVPVAVVRTDTVSGVRRTLIRFTTWDGTLVPAYVLEPQGERVRGAVLVIPGHGPGIAATAGSLNGYEHQAALELARRGFITLTPEVRGFGMLSPQGVSSHRLVAAAALAAGTSYKAVVARDLTLALTVLQHWQGVDPGRLAVTGTSLGGELAVMLAALDPRVRVVVSNSYGGLVGSNDEDDTLSDESRQTPHGCHTMPGINEILTQEDWVRLIAPRPVLVVRGSRNLPGDASIFESRVSEAYRANGVPDRFRVDVEPGAHEFFADATADFLNRWL